MKTVTLTFKVTINADEKIIFDYLTNWHKQSDWILLTTVQKVSTAPNQRGTELQATTKFGPIKFIDTMVVTDWQPNAKIVVEHMGRKILGKGIFKIHKISANNCEFLWEEITPVPFGFIGQTGFVLAKPFIRLLFGLSLKKLKIIIETENFSNHTSKLAKNL